MGQPEGALLGEGFLEVVWEGEFWGSLTNWTNPRPSGLLLISTPAGRRDGEVGCQVLGFVQG